MTDTIRLSCDCQFRQGEGFVHLCPAHNDLLGDLVHGEREACAKIADDYAAKLKDARSVFDRVQTAESLAEMIRTRSNP